MRNIKEEIRVALDMVLYAVEVLVAILMCGWIWLTMFSSEIEDSARANDIKNPRVSDCTYSMPGKYTQFRGQPVCKTVHK